VRLHFDGWEPMYDEWVVASDTDVGPVGSTQALGASMASRTSLNRLGIEMNPPKGWRSANPSKTFDWIKYLEETGADIVLESVGRGSLVAGAIGGIRGPTSG